MFILEVIALTYFAFVVGHNLFFSLVSFGYTEKHFFKNSPNDFKRILVLIPAYKEDSVILSSSKSAIKHNYPADKFKIVVIADSLKEETITTLREEGVCVIPVKFDRSTKVKSLRAALDTEDNYDVAVILDADNIMGGDFLHKINQAYQNGFVAIQGRRVAKNRNTDFAILDGISESINNQIFRKGYSAIGLTVSLIGSGMSFPFPILKKHITDMNSIGGFDRELNLLLLEDRLHVNYFESAIVYDEKVDRAEVFANQRRRWLSSQVVYLKKFFLKGFKELFKGNFAYFEASVLNNLLLPRILTLGSLFVFSITYHFIKSHTALSFNWPLCLLILYIVALVVAIPKKYFNLKLLLALSKLPLAFTLMLINLFKLRNANKNFIHTPHSILNPEEQKE